MQREWKGRWIRDTSSAVFKFDPKRNTYSQLPPELDVTLWQYVIAVDIGGGVNRDNDAISVLAFHPHKRATYLIEEQVTPNRDVTSLALEVKAIRKRLGEGKVVAVVADTGGLGAKVALEMSSRHHLPVVAAKKQDKWSNIALLNGACAHGEFYAPATSAFATEAVKVEKDWDKSTPDRIEIKGHMPDICDSVLYGFVESLAWISKEPEDRPAPGTPEAAAAEARLMFEAARRAVERDNAEKEQRWGPVPSEIGDAIDWGT
jgi:hypothetical protein